MTRKFVVNGIVEDYAQVVGIMRGTSKKEGKNMGRPYAMLHLIKAQPSDSVDGYVTETMFFFTDNGNDVVSQYGITVGDQICPLYVGTGDFKKLLKIDVIPFKEEVKGK